MSTTELAIVSDLITDKKEGKQHNASEVNFEKALTLTGFGKYQWCILFATGLAYMAAGFQTGMNPYIMPAAACDLKLTSHEKGLLNAIFLIGGIVSAFFWGILADQVGRKSVLWVALLADGIVNFCSSFSQEFNVFAAFRFFDGFLAGAPASLTYTYLGEFIGEKERAKCLSILGLFWNLSWLLLPLLALGIIPQDWKIEAPGFLFNSWRLYVMLLSTTEFLGAFLLYKFFPETPKYLFSQGEKSDALYVMEKMYYFNYGYSKGTFPVTRILDDSQEGAPTRRSVILDPAELERIGKTNGKSLERILANVLTQILSLFRPPHVNATMLSTALLFTNMFGYVGLSLWIPELFDRFENHYKDSNETLAVCELMYKQKNLANVTPASSQECHDVEINVNVYLNTFIMATASLLVNLGRSLLPNSVGLKLLSVITMVVSTISSFAIYFLRSSTQNLVVASIFLSFVGLANNVLTSAVCELFPTRIRAQALCAALFVGRLGAALSNILLGYTIDSYCEVPVFLMAGLLLVGTLLSFLLPSDNATPGNKIST